MALWRIALVCVASQCGPRVVAKKSQLDIDMEEPRRILRKYFGTSLKSGAQLTQSDVLKLGSMSPEDLAAYTKAIGFTTEQFQNYLEEVASLTPEEFRAMHGASVEEVQGVLARAGDETGFDAVKKLLREGNAEKVASKDELDEYTEGLLTEMGIDKKEYSDWLSSPAGRAAKEFASDLIKNPIGTGGGSSGDDAETCDMCSAMGKPDQFLSEGSLGWAISKGDAEEVARLVREDPDAVNAPLPLQESYGYTPLAYACYVNPMSAAVVQVLLDAGASLDSRASLEALDPDRPRLEAQGDGTFDLFISTSTPLHNAARHGRVDVVEMLVKAGADVNAVMPAGDTPLHMAAHRNTPAVAKSLLNAGAQIDAQDVGGSTPLFIAASKGNDRLVTFLLRAGADRLIPGRDGRSALSVAAKASTRRLLRNVEADIPNWTKEDVASAILVVALAAACALGVYRCVTSAVARQAERREQELIGADAPAPAPRGPKQRGAKTPRRRDARPRRRENQAERRALNPATPTVWFSSAPATTPSEAETKAEPAAEVGTARSAPEPEPASEPAPEPTVAESVPAPATAASVAESAVEPESEPEPEPAAEPVEPTTVAAPAPAPVQPAEPLEEKVDEEDPTAAPAPPPKGYELVASVLDHLGLDLLPVFVEQCVDDMTLRLLDAEDLSDMGLDASASGVILDAIAMLVDGERARSKKVVTADFVDGVAKHQSVLEEKLREHREEIARLRLTRGEIPEDLRCPLTLDLFCDPVTAADGHTYERVAIEEWFATGSRTSPTTNEPLQSTALIPQHTMKKLVCAFMDTRRRSSVDEDVS